MLDTGSFGGDAARLRMIVAGANVTIHEGADSLTVNAAAAGSLYRRVGKRSYGREP